MHARWLSCGRSVLAPQKGQDVTTIGFHFPLRVAGYL